MKKRIITVNLLLFLVYSFVIWYCVSSNSDLSVFLSAAVLLHSLLLFLALLITKKHQHSFGISFLLVISVGLGSCYMKAYQRKYYNHTQQNRIKYMDTIAVPVDSAEILKENTPVPDPSVPRLK